MSLGSSAGTLSSAARTICAARSSGRMSTSDPLTARPIGERAVATMTASGMTGSSVVAYCENLTRGYDDRRGYARRASPQPADAADPRQQCGHVAVRDSSGISGRPHSWTRPTHYTARAAAAWRPARSRRRTGGTCRRRTAVRAPAETRVPAGRRTAPVCRPRTARAPPARAPAAARGCAPPGAAAAESR